MRSRKIFAGIILSVGIIILVVLITVNNSSGGLSGLVNQLSGPDDSDMASETTPDTSQNATQDQTDLFAAPMDDYPSRVTKKTFGTYVNPQNSPVNPEVFTGFHTGIDLETFSDEQNIEVEFKSICGGELALKRSSVQGYGGVVAQHCTLNGSPVFVIYGHVDVGSIPYDVGDQINKGQVMGNLGQVGVETDNERKHLHLTIRKGSEQVMLGYVRDEAALSDYIDPRTVLAE